MKMNEGGLDRTVRVIAGLALIAAAFFFFNGTWAAVAGIVGAIALITGIVGVCPAYSILGMNTCPVRPKAE
jgi:hypothetical protein